jgi:hypothetical protein
MDEKDQLHDALLELEESEGCLDLGDLSRPCTGKWSSPACCRRSRRPQTPAVAKQILFFLTFCTPFGPVEASKLKFQHYISKLEFVRFFTVHVLCKSKEIMRT